MVSGLLGAFRGWLAPGLVPPTWPGPHGGFLGPHLSLDYTASFITAPQLPRGKPCLGPSDARPGAGASLPFLLQTSGRS